MSESATSPRRTPRQERSRRTVGRILDTAARIFHEQGYSAATTNDIADEADVSVGSMYQYFPNKDALRVALAARHLEDTAAGLVDLLQGLDVEAGFGPVLRAVVAFLVEQHDLDDLHLLAMHQAPRTAAINAELDRARSQLVEMTSHLLTSRIEDQHRRALIARMVVATIDASVHDVILRQPRGAERDVAMELTIRTALSIIDSA